MFGFWYQIVWFHSWSLQVRDIFYFLVDAVRGVMIKWNNVWKINKVK